jgi:hypothetical protein
MDVDRFITKEEFLSIKPFSQGGTVIGGRRFAQITSYSHEMQLEKLGTVDKTGEGICDKVFFFEVFLDPCEPNEPPTFQIISAKVVERYKFISTQEAQKEIALIKAKIKLREKDA